MNCSQFMSSLPYCEMQSFMGSFALLLCAYSASPCQFKFTHLVALCILNSEFMPVYVTGLAISKENLCRLPGPSAAAYTHGKTDPPRGRLPIHHWLDHLLKVSAHRQKIHTCLVSLSCLSLFLLGCI
jgi:hypothetical protein